LANDEARRSFVCIIVIPLRKTTVLNISPGSMRRRQVQVIVDESQSIKGPSLDRAVIFQESRAASLAHGYGQVA